MELQQLRYVSALARELHFLKAAEKSHVSQPTLSQQVKKLEDELGSPLFERSSRKVRLTAAGKKFLPYALETLAAAEKGISALQKEEGEVTGTVKLGAIPTMCPYLIPQLLPRLKKSAPKVVLELYEETTSSLLERLRGGEIDLGLLSPPVQERGISVLVLGKETFYLAVSKKHRLAKAGRIQPGELASERLLVLQEGHCFGGQSLDYCKRTQQNPQVIFRGSSLLSVLRLAAQGQGVTFAPQMAVRANTDRDLKFVPFASPEPVRQIGLVWRLTSPLSRAHKLVMELMAEGVAGSR